MDNETMKPVKKNPLKFVVVLIIALVAAVGLSYFTYTYYQSYQRESVKDKFYNASPDESDTMFTISDSEELMFDTEAYKTFEAACLGNTNNDLIAGGSYVQKGTISCYSEEKTIATVDGKEIVVSDHSSSYINIMDSNIFYRDDTDRKVYKYSLDDQKTECVIDANCGETAVTVRGIYYIDYATKTLNYSSFADSEQKQLYEERIDSFAVIGESAFVLNDDKVFGLLKSDGAFMEIDTDIDRFFFDGSVYIQKGSNIYILDSFTNAEHVVEDIDGYLIYESDGYLYTINNKRLRQIPVTGGEGKEIYTLKEKEIIKEISITGDTFEITLFTEKDGIYHRKTISIDGQ